MVLHNKQDTIFVYLFFIYDVQIDLVTILEPVFFKWEKNKRFLNQCTLGNEHGKCKPCGSYKVLISTFKVLSTSYCSVLFR